MADPDVFGVAPPATVTGGHAVAHAPVHADEVPDLSATQRYNVRPF
jgi:hypothetical protein